MDLDAILGPLPSPNTTQSAQPQSQPGLFLPSLEEWYPDHKFKSQLEEAPTMKPVLDHGDPRAARNLRQWQTVRDRWAHPPKRVTPGMRCKSLYILFLPLSYKDIG